MTEQELLEDIGSREGVVYVCEPIDLFLINNVYYKMVCFDLVSGEETLRSHARYLIRDKGLPTEEAEETTFLLSF